MQRLGRSMAFPLAARCYATSRGDGGAGPYGRGTEGMAPLGRGFEELDQGPPGMATQRPGKPLPGIIGGSRDGTGGIGQIRKQGHPPPGFERAPPRDLPPELATLRRDQFHKKKDAPAPPPPPPMEETEMGEPEPPSRPAEEPKFLSMETNEQGIMVLRMKRKPVNSLNLEMFAEINEWLKYIGSGEEVKGVVLTSEIASVFSAGIDINELNAPKPERFAQFWTEFQETWLVLNSFPKPVIAAINGNAPAGGCVLSLCCDYRIMARAGANGKPYRIGLNETKLGIVAPPWVMGSMAYVVGNRKAEKMLQLGETPTAEEALQLGLVDAVVEESEVVEAAVKEMARWIAIPEQSRWMTKDMMRRELFRFMASEEERQYDTQFFGEMIQQPDVVATVSQYLQRLGGKK